jgi:hypothetical protein
MPIDTQTSGSPFEPVAPKVVFESQLETYLIDKAPFQIPAPTKEAIVKYVPWINLVFMILLLPAVLAVLGLGALFTPFSFLGGFGGGFAYIFTLLFTIAILVLRALALPGLFNRKRSGWVFSYYGDLINILLNIISFSIIGLLFDVLFLFVLFQIRSYYK